jgi:hypothetical protein
MCGLQYPNHGDFIATLELGAAQAIFPGLERECSALDFFEGQLAEKIRNVSKSEDGVERVIARLRNERFDYLAANAVRFGALRDRERTNLTRGGGVKVQRAATYELAAGVRHGKITDALGELELCAGQHDAL